MHENHANEQYFFDETTVDALCGLLERFANPCVICAPMLGQRMLHRGRQVTTLDIDERFAHLPGFIRWDILTPQHLDERFDLILCDPPFFNVSLSQLFDALRLLAHFDYCQPMMVTYLTRRSDALLGTFAPFGLKVTDLHPGYQTVRRCAKTDIVFHANFTLHVD